MHYSKVHYINSFGTEEVKEGYLEGRTFELNHGEESLNRDSGILQAEGKTSKTSVL